MVKNIIQPEINIGLAGHVDNGKTTLLQRISGVWADTHSEELKRGITIRLGYANATFYKTDKFKGVEAYKTEVECKQHPEWKCKPIKKVSFIDAPGHETLMATMLSGASIMDAALLLIAANEDCPQPQTKEHLMALDIIGIKNIIIVQNKIDLVTEKQAKENYNQIKDFIKGTVAEKAPIIPISAQHGANIDYLIQTIVENFKTPERNPNKPPLMIVARSFDINRPGTKIKNLVGGALGGALKQGILKKNDEIEIVPGLKKEKDNKIIYKSIKTKIISIRSGQDEINEATPGGSIAISTTLDPSIVKSDSLIGSVIGHPDHVPKVWYTIKLKLNLLDDIVGLKQIVKVEPIKKGEILMLNANSAATVGTVTDLSKDNINLNLKLPVAANLDDRLTISRRVDSRFRLIGWGEIVE